MKTKTQSNIIYYTGNLFDNINEQINNTKIEKDIIIPNISNIDLKIKTGFLKQAITIYPVIQEALEVQQYKLGKNCLIRVKRVDNNNLYFCQMFCDKHSKFRNINYIHLINCMIDVRNFCLDLKKSSDKNIEIHAPRFGTAMSGGRWSTIADLIDDCWFGIPVFVYKDY
jgi:hypothetical protein